MNSKELKIGELMANSVEDHWFNPATLAHYLAQQPLWTIDRIMEVVVWVIEKQARRAEDEIKHGRTSHGLTLAYNLDKQIDKYKSTNQFDNLKLP